MFLVARGAKPEMTSLSFRGVGPLSGLGELGEEGGRDEGRDPSRLARALLDSTVD